MTKGLLLIKFWRLCSALTKLAGIFLTGAVVVFVYQIGEINWNMVKDQLIFRESLQTTVVHKVSISKCDLFSGRWVYDNLSYPLYQEKHCSFMENEFACEKYGRKDLKYRHWRWQPDHCDLPRFNGKALLEKIRGKKLVYVGDSLNRNQWRSMLCLIESSLPPSSKKSVVMTGNWYLLTVPEYNATIGFYWSPMLVETNCDDIKEHRVRPRVLRIKAIENHARHWTNADILIFDSYVWWIDPNMTLLWGTFGSPDAINKTVEMKLRRYEIALRTWSDWLEFNVNRTRTKLFFMSRSPYHYKDEMLGMKQNCYDETEPIPNGRNLGTASGMERIAESTIRKLNTRGLNVQYLNITNLSLYRKDGHPSIYRTFWHMFAKEKPKDARSYSDCIHWCLPGVPDVWNEILYSYVMNT